MSNSSIWLYQVVTFQARVNLQKMPMKEYSTLSKAGASPSDGLVSYPGRFVGWGWGLTPSVEMQPVYSTALDNQPRVKLLISRLYMI